MRRNDLYACVNIPVVTRASKEILNAWILFLAGPTELHINLGDIYIGNINHVMKGTINLLIQSSGGIFKKLHIDHQYVKRCEGNVALLDLKGILEAKGYAVNDSLHTMDDVFGKNFEVGYCLKYKHFYSFHQGGIEIEYRDDSYVIVDRYKDYKNISVYVNGANTEYKDLNSQVDIKLLGFMLRTCTDTNIEKILDILDAAEGNIFIDKDILATIIKDQVPRADLKLIFEQKYESEQGRKHVLFLIAFIGENVEIHERLLEFTTKDLHRVITKLWMVDPDVAKYIEEVKVG